MPAYKWSPILGLASVVLPATLYLLYRFFFSGEKLKQIVDYKVTISDAEKRSLIQVRPRRSSSSWYGVYSSNSRLIIVLVGLPARGKSYISTMLLRYLRFIGYSVEIFNVGNVRRKMGYSKMDASFFERGNEAANKLREEFAVRCMEEMFEWLSEKSHAVALFDATNTTRARREVLFDISKSNNVPLLFVESICDDEDILDANYAMKLQNQDYKGVNPERALQDFLRRVAEYEKVYQTLEDDENGGELSYVKVFNVGKKVVSFNSSGFLKSQITQYLQNIHICQRKIYMFPYDARHTEGQENAIISEILKILRFELKRNRSFSQIAPPGTPNYTELEVSDIVVYTSTEDSVSSWSQRVGLHHMLIQSPLLNKTALKRSMNYEESEAEKGEEEDGRFEINKDLIVQLTPVVIELERERVSVFIIASQEVIRHLTGYFCSTPLSDYGSLSIPSDSLITLTPSPHNTQVDVIPLLFEGSTELAIDLGD